MFKKKIFGIFGKGADDKSPVPKIPEQPLISEEKISYQEGEQDDSESIENPEDIISKLAQINNIIGDDEEMDDDDDHDISHFFGEDEDEDEGLEIEEEVYEQPIAEDVNLIHVPAESILASIPAEALAVSVDELNAKYAGNSDYQFSFGKEDISYGLSIGKVEVAFSDLVNKIPINIFCEAIDSFHDQKVNIDLVSILPLVPPAWFALGDQDASQEEMVNEMEDLFPSLSLPEPEEAEEEEVAEEDAQEHENFGLVDESEEIPAIEEPSLKPQDRTVDLAAKTTITSLQEIRESEPQEIAPSQLTNEIAVEHPSPLREFPAVPQSSLQEPVTLESERHLASTESLSENPMLQNPTNIELDEEPVADSDVYSIPLSPSIQNEELEATSEISGPVPIREPVPEIKMPQISLRPSEPIAESEMNSIPLSLPVQNEEMESFPEVEEQAPANDIVPKTDLPKISLQYPDPVEEKPALEIADKEQANEITAPAVPLATPRSVDSSSGLSLKQPESVPDEVISLDDIPEIVAEFPDTLTSPLSTPEPIIEEVKSPLQPPPQIPIENPTAPVLKPPATLEMSVADIPDTSQVDPPALKVNEAEISEDVEAIEKVVSSADADADDVQKAATELLIGNKPHESLNVSEKAVPMGTIKAEDSSVWKSRAPNGIDINRSGVEELCLLASVGEHLAQSIIDHRTEHGKFSQLQDLLNIPGLGNHTYRKMTRLSAKTEIANAELHVNKMLEIDGDIVSLNQVVKTILTGQQLNAIFISSIDGLILAKSTADNEYSKLSESLAAVAPQLYKRAKKALNQGQLPAADMYTFYIGKNAVTFAGSDQLFVVFIHNTDYPNQQQLKKCRKITQELVWYCSYRAVIS